ncbi:MAG: sulfatase [bacterium]
MVRNISWNDQKGDISNFAVGLTYGLFCGFILGVSRFLLSDIARAYLSTGKSDVILSYLQFFLNQEVFIFVLVFVVLEILLLLIMKILPGFGQKAISRIRMLSAAGLLFAVVAYEFNTQQQWFPAAFSIRAIFYDAIILLGSFLVAFVLARAQVRLSRGGSSKVVLSTAVSFVTILVALNGLAFIKKHQFQKGEPNVLVILIDALRYDHLGCYGYAKPTSPNIDNFARESLVFTNSFSQSNHTKPSIASLFTSLYPSQHHVVRSNRRDAAGNYISDILDDSFKTMAEYLQEAGYNTAGFIDQGQLRAYMGFAQGFDYYDTYLGIAPLINQKFIGWLPVNKYRKFFAYLHYLDVHAPYTPPAKYIDLFGLRDKVNYVPAQGKKWIKARENWKKFNDDLVEGKIKLTQDDIQELKSLYDGEIRALDDELGLLFQKLKKEGVYDNSLIILTADHGEGFMEHGMTGHGNSLYDELLRVPLIMRFPNGERRGVVDIPVQAVDLLPTILDFLGQARDANLMGKSILELMNATDHVSQRPIVSERGSLVAYRIGNYKYIYDKQHNTGELYDLQSDPGEQHNLSNHDNNKKALEMQKELKQYAQAIAKATPQSKGVKLDKKTIKKLKSLGYIR